MHDVEAEVAGLDLAEHGVEVGAVAVHLGAVRVHHLGDLDDVAVEEAERAGERDHQRGDGVAVRIAGVSDLIVIASKDGVIVLPRERAQDVKALKALTGKQP